MAFPGGQTSRVNGLSAALPPYSKIHHTFHVSCLKKKLGAKIQPLATLLPVDSKGEVVLEPKAMVDCRVRRRGYRPMIEVLIKWVGLPKEENSWEGLSRMCKLYPHLMDKVL